MSLDLTSYRAVLSAYIERFLRTELEGFSQHPIATEVIEKLAPFSISGKQIRGSLVLASYQLAGNQDVTPALPLAAAVEIMNTSLLIHDDIMDHDMMRRGKPSMAAQWMSWSKTQQLKAPEDIGNSLAICVGDLGFFWSFKLLSQLQVEAAVLNELITLFSQEYLHTGFGQMRDVIVGSQSQTPSREDVEKIYIYKTARYTLSLPLLLGSTLAGVPAEVRRSIDNLSETLGLIFQIKDDELGLFGTEQQIGKPVTSDVKEGKKTLYYLATLEKAGDQERIKFESLYGKGSITPEELDVVRQIVSESGARSVVDKEVAALEHRANEQITTLPQPWKEFFTSFLQFNILRQK